MMALSLAAEPRLRLGDGLGPGGGATGGLGAAFGIADGLLVAGAIDPSGLLGQTPFRQAAGGALLGASLEMGAGFVLSKRFAFHGDAAAVMTGGKLAGALLGAGAARLATAEAGRADTLATLGGSLGGLAGAALAEEVAPLDDVDATAALASAGSSARWHHAWARRRGPDSIARPPAARWPACRWARSAPPPSATAPTRRPRRSASPWRAAPTGS
jgi:hypothetical protein